MTPIGMVVADVDGTLLKDDKTLTPATVKAVGDLRDAGVYFTMASARPPLGMRGIAAALGVTGPVAAFNGGVFTEPPIASSLESRTLSTRLVQPVADLLAGNGLEMWAYCGMEWFVPQHGLHGARVDWEISCVGFLPTAISDWSLLPGRPSKLVGVAGDDTSGIEAARDAIDVHLRTAVSAGASTPFYLDVTPPGVDKGLAVRKLAEIQGARNLAAVAVIGDGYVDIPMFLEKGVGLSIAMGNAPHVVQMMADKVTLSNEEDGFAEAVRQLLEGELA